MSPAGAPTQTTQFEDKHTNQKVPMPPMASKTLYINFIYLCQQNTCEILKYHHRSFLDLYCESENPEGGGHSHMKMCTLPVVLLRGVH